MAKVKCASIILREKGMFNSYFIIISDDAPSWLNQLGTTLKKEFPDNQKCVYTLVKETLAFIDKNPTSSFDEFICHQYKSLSYLEDSDIFEWASEMCTTKVFKDANESLNIVSSASIIDALISIYKEVTKKIVKIVYDAYNNRVTQEKAINDLLNQINAVIKKYQYNHGKIEKKFTYFLDLLNYIR